MKSGIFLTKFHEIPEYFQEIVTIQNLTDNFVNFSSINITLSKYLYHLKIHGAKITIAQTIVQKLYSYFIIQ